MRHVVQRSVTVWLEEIGLEQFARLFVEQQIELCDLPALNEQDLEKLSVPLGPRKRLMQAIAALNQTVGGDRSAQPAAQPQAARLRLQIFPPAFPVFSQFQLTTHNPPFTIRHPQPAESVAAVHGRGRGRERRQSPE